MEYQTIASRPIIHVEPPKTKIYRLHVTDAVDFDPFKATSVMAACDHVREFLYPRFAQPHWLQVWRDRAWHPVF